jgi:peptidyl-prolyl cis-trans isomerase SurA
MKLLSYLIVCISLTQVLWADSMHIVAVVGKKPITQLDLEERMYFTIATTGMENTNETRNKIGSQILKSLIEEKLKLQESERMKITVSDKEIEQDWIRMEHQNNMPKGALKKFFKETGIRESVLKGQIKADLSWTRYITARYGPTISIGDEEVKETLEKLEQNKSKTRYLVSEIFLSTNSDKDTSKVKAAAQNMVNQIRKDAQFHAIATELSETPSAKHGGDLGWIHKEHYNKKILGQTKTIGDALEAMKNNQISNPIETDDGIYIIKLRDRLNPLDTNQTDRKYRIRQIIYKFPDNPSALDIKTARSKLLSMKINIKSPDDMEKAQKKLGGSQPPERWIYLSELGADVRGIVKKLKLNTPCDPFKLHNNLSIIMVCETKNESPFMPNKDNIKNELLNDKLMQISKRQLRDLQQSSLVDIRF